MKNIQFLSILITSVFGLETLYAQDTTEILKPKIVSLEEMIGDKRQFLQLIVNKVFEEKRKIGLLSLTSYASDYNYNLGNNEFQNTSLIYHHFFKGISINSGASFTSVEGLKNFVGLHYIYQSKTLSLIYIPSYYFINSHKVSNFALIEYKPSINENWSVYSRLQLHYNHDLENDNHFRSYAYSRLGLTYKFFSFGLAHNLDRYGEDKLTKNNIGVFLKLTI
ncbi:MAG: hypothetical protein CVV25_13010 [Ignavibacteriae bacterium HGW-Ignavibacteriae-4]|jgi:hypothetical protein|nr:MAG: hypothetical protein CVV25_13010 [Ignavibacteriae bacterium HGW-Ignavibacteriae-4]